MPEMKRPLKVFLCHASADKPNVRELYRYLRRRGIKPWFDEVDLIGGQDWQVEIPKALATSDAIVICLTRNSVDKEGYIQKEIKFALDKALEMPEGRIFLIPVRFEECEVPYSLSRYQWVDLFDEAGYARMMRALKFRASQLQRIAVEFTKKDIEEAKLSLEKAGGEQREATEQAERETTKKATQETLQREIAESIRKEKPEHEAAEKSVREKAKREAAEKVNREKAEHRTAQIATLKGSFSKSFDLLRSAISKAKPFLRIGGIIGIFLLLFWVGSWAMPEFFSPAPTITASATASRTATITPSYSPTPLTKTLEPSATPTAPGQTALPTEITDAKGVPMVLVSAGDFKMGTPNQGHEERPVHQVYLDAYYIDKYEVTNALYKVCVDADVCEAPTHTDKYMDPERDQHPVAYVNWYMAEAYCEWRGARLPTEAEWEKAARSTDERRYPWGGEGLSDIDSTYANYRNSDTMPVGSYPKGVSPYGAYDLAGNVKEWVADWYDEDYYAVSPATNPTGPENGYLRVTRSGTWSYGMVDLRSASRGKGYPADSSSGLGFRCARSP